MRHLYLLKCSCYRRLDSFEIWVAFTSVYSEERIKSIQYRNELIDNPSLPLEKYVVPATSQSFQWITLLTICSRGLAPGQLVNLCSLHNLGALDIMLHPTAINREAVQDNVIRAWSRSASDDGAFLRLRVLSLRGWKSVTGRSLGYLSCFPVLVFFMVEDTCITRRHNEFGPTDWDCQRTAKMDWAYEMLPFPKNCWKIALRRCHMEARCFLAGRCGMPQAPEEPILHLSLGVMDWFSSHDRMTGPPVIFFRRLETRPESIYPREQRPEMTKDGFGQGAANRAERRSLRSAKQRPIGEVLEQFTDIRQAGLGGKTYVAD